MECKSCHKTYRYLLIHLYRNNTKYNCRQDYTKQQLRKLKKKAKNLTTTNTNEKRRKAYNPHQRRQRYLQEKGKHNINTITKNENLKTQSLQTDNLNIPVQYVLDPNSPLKCKIVLNIAKKLNTTKPLQTDSLALEIPAQDISTQNSAQDVMAPDILTSPKSSQLLAISAQDISTQDAFAPDSLISPKNSQLLDISAQDISAQDAFAPDNLISSKNSQLPVISVQTILDFFETK